jgi:hypothetical protein
MYRLSIRRLTTILVAAASVIVPAFSCFAQKTEPTVAYFRSGAFLERAHIEVTLFRFIVNTQSRDDVLQRDGAGDEVCFSRVAILHNRRTGSRVLSDGLDFSQTFGESPPNSSRAGHATTRGGLKSGDDILLPPITLFSDELVRGENAATIILSVWEMDGPRDLWSRYKDFLDNYRPDMERIALNTPQTAAVLRDWDSSFTSNSSSGEIATVVALGDGPLGLGEVKDRPIGMYRRGNYYDFIPKLMILNFDNAIRMAETNQGSGLGVIKISYRDDTRLAGDYTLFVKIRRV